MSIYCSGTADLLYKGGKTMAGRAEVWCYPPKTILLFILLVVFFFSLSFSSFNKQGGGDGAGVYKQYKLLCVCRAITGYGLKHMCVV
jgi:hypothetical protein